MAAYIVRRGVADYEFLASSPSGRDIYHHHYWTYIDHSDMAYFPLDSAIELAKERADLYKSDTLEVIADYQFDHMKKLDKNTWNNDDILRC